MKGVNGMLSCILCILLTVACSSGDGSATGGGMAPAAAVGMNMADAQDTPTVDSGRGLPSPESVDTARAQTSIRVGAERTGEYLPLLRGKRVGLYSNHTGVLPDGRHTLDVLTGAGTDVRCIFSPEHGFRGTADAGEKVSSSVDAKSGVRIVSLYSRDRLKAMAEAMKDLDIVMVDIQDVGLRYYTYYITMLDLMDEAARTRRQVMVLDRPNPNGMTVDGPILDMRYASSVGRLPIPVVHGLTLGELALMINGEGWLKGGRKADLTVIPCEGYTHQTRYRLPVAPSPNLPTMRAVYLYPSLCYFEATDVSLGRGTDHPFEQYGHPGMRGRRHTFTPTSRPGAKTPPQQDKLCHGVYLGDLDDEELIAQGINLAYVIDAYTDLKGESHRRRSGRGPGASKTEGHEPFFTSFFENLIGNGDIRGMIERGMTAQQIKATWAGDVAQFRQQRQPYLLYPE